jgi:hypothetical protein
LDAFGGAVPQKPSHRTVEGLLLHSLLEAYSQADSGAGPFRPRATLLRLLKVWKEENKQNPRINSTAIANKVAVEEILRAFAQAGRYITPLVVTARPKAVVGTSSDSALPSASEIWLRDPESKLCGRADHVGDGRIVDFKTGQEDTDHTHQILFYAALYLAVTGHVPKELTLVYTQTGAEVDVPVPSVSVLQDLLSATRRRASLVEKDVMVNKFQAKPDSAKCSLCHVRGLCDEYWKARLTFREETAGLTDYEPSPSAKIEIAPFGVYVRDVINSKPVSLYIPSRGLQTETGFKMRVLFLRLVDETDKMWLSLTQFTELYLVTSELDR